MIKLSKRLYQIVSFIKDDARVIDIGCDHAKIAIYLAQSKKGVSIIASDISNKVYQQVKLKLKNYQLEDKIVLRLGSGLEVLKDDQVDTVIMAGLGGNKIITLLKSQKDTLKAIDNIIIQANNEFPKLRKTLAKLGYFIFDEVLVEERSKIYTIIYFKKGKRRYNRLDFLVGPILRKQKGILYLQLIKEMLKKHEFIIAHLPKRYWLKRYCFKYRLKLLKKEIKKIPLFK